MLFNKFIVAIGFSLFCLQALSIAGRCQSFKPGESLAEAGYPLPQSISSAIKSKLGKNYFVNGVQKKFIAIEFLTANCRSCFYNLVNLNNLQKKYREKIQLIIVARDEFGEKGTKKVELLLAGLKRRFSLNELLVIYDTVISKNILSTDIKNTLWVDTSETVVATTYASDLNEQNLVNLFSSRKIFYFDDSPAAIDALSKNFDRKKLLLIGGNGGADTDFLYRSILAPWKVSTSINLGAEIGLFPKMNIFQATGLSLKWLFNYAYFGLPFIGFDDSLYGKACQIPDFSSVDSSHFSPDFITGRNIYSYSICVPREAASGALLKKIMQKDLQVYLPFTSSVEIRKMPYWKLVMKPSAALNLIAKAGNPPFTDSTPAEKYFEEFSPNGFVIKNRPVSFILRALWANNQSEPPFVNETGIECCIDIRIDALMNDIDDIRSSLQAHGLDLEKGFKDMKVIVIKPIAQLGVNKGK